MTWWVFKRLRLLLFFVKVVQLYKGRKLINKKMKKISIIDWIALILIIVGGLNWGLVAFKFNLVSFLFGSWVWLETTVYALVGLSALWTIVWAIKKDTPAVQV